MDRKQKLGIAAIVAVLAFSTVTSAAANFSTFFTPLYTMRMEQASSKMNFLPTPMNGFTYFTERGQTFDYHITGSMCGCWGNQTPQIPLTCNTCDEYYCEEPTHCGTCVTCYSTCLSTCPNTCQSTCPNTCSTCSTCGGSTCEPATCPWTQWPYCEFTMSWPTCYWVTCEWLTCYWC
ncbi:MAG: hypothetical protein WBA22_12140 [Candidatus Methanofastidiosia archaeon]